MHQAHELPKPPRGRRPRATGEKNGRTSQAPQVVEIPQVVQPSRPAPPSHPPQPPRRAHPQQGPQTPAEASGPRIPPTAETAWRTAEQIAESLRPRIAELWAEVLTRCTDGDQDLAGKVYHVLSGSHLLGELWRDERIDEIHIHGTQVTVCGGHGVHRVPGFPDQATARRAIETIKAARDRTGAVVSTVNGSVVVSRRDGTGPDATALVVGGVVTEEQLAQIEQALRRVQAVTVTGPAARIVVRALASLIPAGSRVFVAAYARLPAGCLTAAVPMEADYVVGVRPGAAAERMAAAGQVGALIANPETQIPTALRFTVSGQSAAPEAGSSPH
ncbi:hypothetical protein [Actinomadura sp. CNU-125]|uniref:hypothetical protein n=1 Tax=Actinomadura sp. CNU-125 TaxID=1904961 RepID=UPI001177FEA9|nr:hypothetical protein [Actinomadura sp. CNU-125]